LFDRHNVESGFPLCISVPHAGRDYPDWVPGALAVPLAKTRSLEDRYADALLPDAIARGHAALIARSPRLIIDLNRAETDIDHAMVRDIHMLAARPSVRARGGLGLVPERLGTVGRLWRARLSASDLAARIAAHHRPYHRALGDMLTTTHVRHGIAVLLDLHSMPSLAGPDAADIVIGDLHGRAADPVFAAAARDLLSAKGLKVAYNAPYAGGYILERHTRPAKGVHGLQIEIDRRLYLDSKLDQPGQGASAMAAIVGELADALAHCAASQNGWQIAAE
jgi:N-formylglutamate amidohydrolase